jgi:transposase
MFSGRISETKIDSGTLVVAVDLAKNKNIAYARKVQGADLKMGSFGHSRPEFQRIFDTVMRFSKEQKCNKVVVCMESTSVYGIPLQHFLMYKPITLVLINPLHTKRAKEITDNTPNKSDEKDPQIMADIAQLGRFLSVVIPEGVEADLRHNVHARDRAIVRRGVLCNQVHDLTFEIFPELLGIMNDLRTATVQQLLKGFCRPIDILALGMDGLSKKIFSFSRGRMRDSEKKAKALYEAAKSSVGIRHGSESIAFEIKNLINEIETIQKYIDTIEVKLKELLQRVPYSKWLLSIPRLGSTTVAAIIGEFGNLPSFQTIDEVMKFAGLNLYEISSGKQKSNCRISKRGRSLLRKFLYYAALNMIRKGGIFHETYKEYKQANRMKHVEAIVAISRKLLRVMYALVRTECLYVRGYRKPLAKALQAA